MVNLMKELWIIGGGAGEWDRITLKALEQIEQAAHTAVQTAQMPLFANLTHGGTDVIALDSCYEQAEDFEDDQITAPEEPVDDVEDGSEEV